MIKREVITAKRFLQREIMDIKKCNGIITEQTEMKNGRIDINFYFISMKDVVKYDNLLR